MLCNICKENVANVHFTKIINGEVEEQHLCESCAKKHHKDNFNFDNSYSFNKFFSGLFDNLEEEVPKTETDIACSSCGLTYNEFKKAGKFGCAQCYVDFKEGILSMLKGIHGHEYHKGKIPNKANTNIKISREIDELNKKLEDAVKKEEFEKAAVIRDEIRSVKENLDSLGE